jgi:hypothetical protein
MSPSRDARTTGRPPRGTPLGRPQFPSVVVRLPFDLLAHLEGTGIAAGFGLRSCSVKRDTVVELGRQDAEDLMILLKALADELRLRCEHWRRQASRSPITVKRRTATEQKLHAIDSAAQLIRKALAESPAREDGQRA